MEIKVNGKTHDVKVGGNTPLLTVLREHLDLTGSKYGCGEGVCGACTVLLNGVPVRSCITQAGSVQNKEITTIEGLSANGKLHPVQDAFLEVDPFQCAYCASGMLMSAVALLRRNPAPTPTEIADSMQGNVCRCCAYPFITEAIEKAAQH